MVDFLPQFIAGALSCHRNCNHDFASAGAHSSDRSQHAGASGEAVVYQDGDAALGRFRWAAVPVSTFPPFDLMAFLFGCCVHYLLRDAEFMDDCGIESHYPTRRDCTHRQLRESRYAKFANGHDVEWEVQSESNFVSDRDAPARQAKDDSILAANPDTRSQDGLPQDSAGISAILKDICSQQHNRLTGEPGPLGRHDGT
jgi:hypothetical protein